MSERQQPTVDKAKVSELIEAQKGLKYKTTEFFKNYGSGVVVGTVLLRMCFEAAVTSPEPILVVPLSATSVGVAALYGWKQKEIREDIMRSTNPQKYEQRQRARWIAEGRTIDENGIPSLTEAEIEKAEKRRLKQEREAAKEAERIANYIPTKDLKGWARFKREANEWAFYFLAARH